jgi:arylsulfatase A-like enzyme
VPDPAFPFDGENLLPVLTGAAPPHARTLYWRFGGAGGQRAVREENWKYLSIAGTAFLFDVLRDPRERANLKDRHKDVFARLEHAWEQWNAAMIPEPNRMYRNPGLRIPDRYQIPKPVAPG